MFGYLRPDKDDLLVREFSVYRAVYCGICKQIKLDYGNIPRVSLSYDLTFLAILLIAMTESDAQAGQESCVLNPFRKKPISKNHPALTICAAASVIFAYHKLLDEIRDDKKILAYAGRLIIKRAYRKAATDYPEIAFIISEGTDKLEAIERSAPNKESYLSASEIFGRITCDLLKEVSGRMISSDIDHRKEIISAMGILGMNIGCWIYLMDAVDDMEEDKIEKHWNPFSLYGKAEAAEIAEKTLISYENNCDETAALLPYKRYAGIISNVFREGMPLMRNNIMSGNKPGRL